MAFDRRRFIEVLSRELEPFGFSKQPSAHCSRLLVKKTWMTNRAIAIAEPKTRPTDMARYLDELHWQVAAETRYVPLIYALGVQLVVLWPNTGEVVPQFDPQDFVATFDNQQSIIQSVTIIDLASGQVAHGRSYGQVITGPIQDRILSVCEDEARSIEDNAKVTRACPNCGDFMAGFSTACKKCQPELSQQKQSSQRNRTVAIGFAIGLVFVFLTLIPAILFALA